jgi:TPP-dependent pyruvate/acetoin dehydrogenase alpha subunit
MSTRLYEQMVLIRTLEDRLQELCLEGKAGDLHFNKGQEAIAVGVISALEPTDHTVTHHRTIAHAVAKGANLHKLVAEILGKATGYNGGRAGEMHLSIPDIRHAFSFQLVGTCVPVAVGLAWALRHYKKTREVVAVFFGDAASSNGAIHEALNIASIQHVPILLVCENNGLAGNVKRDRYLPTETVAERMAAYGFGPAWTLSKCPLRARKVDGNDVASVAREASEAIGNARELSSPMLLECETTRLCWHKQGQRDLRSKEELDELAKRDPIDAEAKRLEITMEQDLAIHSDAKKQVDDAIARAEADPYPEA